MSKAVTPIAIALVCVLGLAGSSGTAHGQSSCDADGDGLTTDVDLVNVLRHVAELSSACTLASCDTDASGSIDVADGEQMLRAAADLPSVCAPLSDVIVLSPRTFRLTVGGSRFYSAIAPTAGGDPVNVTQRVTYTSSDPTVAQAPNVQGTKSQVIALSPGVTTISAHDPLTGFSSTPGGDATLTVEGALESISLDPAHRTLIVGESGFYTAVGQFAGGVTRNLTRRLEYSSSNAAVVAAPNEPGFRSRVTAVSRGDATITAYDPRTDVVSSAATVTVLGTLESLTLAPQSATRSIGNSIFYTVTGHFAAGHSVNLTQGVEYTSSNEAVAVAPNETGMRSRVDPVGVGQTMISAERPGTGIVSNVGVLTVIQ